MVEKSIKNISEILSEKNYREEPWSSENLRSPKIFDIVKREDVGYVEAAQTLFNGGCSRGNGAALRVAPIGIFLD